MIALNNTLFVFLTWVLPRVYSAVVLAVALGLSSAPLVVHAESVAVS
jgi:ABC-type enterobactin transport system permease subunit